MELGTDSSPSEVQTPEAPQVGSPQTPASPQVGQVGSPEAPQVDSLPESPEAASLQASDADGAPELKELPGEEKAAEPKVEDPGPQAPSPAEWKSPADINVDAFPEVARPHLRETMNWVATYTETLAQERELDQTKFNTAQAKFTSLIDALEAADGPDGQTKVLTDGITKRDEFITKMSDDLIKVTWRAFLGVNPGFSRAPKNVQEAFAQQVEHASFGVRFKNADPVDNLTEAFRYACYKAGVDPASLQAVVTSPTPGLAPATSSRDAQRAAAITDGKRALNPPSQGVDDMSFDEIMDRDDHLLDDMFTGRDFMKR